MPHAKIRRYAPLFSLLCGLALCLPWDAHAASWEWSRRDGRERVVIRLDDTGRPGEAVRDGRQSLAVRLEKLPQNIETRQAPPSNSLFRGIRLDPATNSLRIDTSTPAFGFVVTSPGNGNIVLDMFPDALGARWRPDGTVAPAGVPFPTAPENVEVPAAAPTTASATTPATTPVVAPASAPQAPAPTQVQPSQGQTPPAAPAAYPAAYPAPTGQAQVAPETGTRAPRAETPVASSSPSTVVPSTTSATPPVITPQEQPRNSLSVVPASPVPPGNGGPSSPGATAAQPLSPPPGEAPVSVASPQAGGPVSVTINGSAPHPQSAQPAVVSAAPAQASAPAASPQPAAPAPAPVNSPGVLPQSAALTAPPQATASTVTAPVATAPTAVAPAAPAQVQAAAPGSQISITVNTGANGTSTPASPGIAITSGNTAPSTPTPSAPVVSPSQPAPAQTTGNQVSAPMHASAPDARPIQLPSTTGTLTSSGGALSGASEAVPAPATEESTPSPLPPTETANAAPSVTIAESLPENSSVANVDTAPAAATPAAPEETSMSDSGSVSEGKDPKEEAGDAPAQQAPIYVDEQGNPVPPPPDIPALLKDSNEKMERGEYAAALPNLEILRHADLSPDAREDVLYNYMKSLYERYHPNFGEHAEEIIEAANAAMNYNPDSYRVPEALSTLASINIAMGNIEDAKGYVYLMRRKYHGNPQVPSSLLNLGKEFLRRQDYADASIAFTQILEEYPESKNAKDAGLLQVHSLYKQGHYDRALTLIEFVDRRWPRIYLEDEQYLPIAADVQVRQGKYDEALETYWKQYNLHPSDATTPGVLMRIGELYYQTKRPLPAGKALEELVRAFPDSPEASRALLLLGENGINDGNPDLDELLAIFERPNPRIPSIFYQRIVRDYPTAPEAISARLRTIAWQYWNKEYVPAMDAARSFMIDYEDKPESLRARDILLRAFAVELSNSLSEENYERVLSLWERYPQVQSYYQPLEPELRVALARAQLNRGNEAAGLELLAPFLETYENPDYGLYAYNLYLSSYLRAQNWDGILTLGDKVRDWKLPDEARRQLDYAMALSAENLNLPGRALPLWKKLAPLSDIPLYQRAYANYFLARDAERRQDLRDSYQYNLDTLGMFTQLQDEQSPYADSERIRESIAALMDVTEIAGRYAEALEWAAKYAAFVPSTSPDYAGLRFREARLHRKMGDTTRWRAILQGIVDKEPDSVFGKMAASELHTSNVARDLSRFTEQN